MTVFTDKVVKYVPRLMTDLQIDRIQACGIFGNLGTETGGFIHLQELKPVVAGSKGGYGWMQWTGPRRRKYEAWCTANSLNPALDETNYKYLVLETKTDEAKSLVQLRRTTTLDAAAYTFMKLNLRPGVEHIASRQKYAKMAYDATAKSSETSKQSVNVGVPIAIGIPTVMATEPRYWPWIIGAIVISIATGWFLVRRHHKHEEQRAMEASALLTKKGKKTNG